MFATSVADVGVDADDEAMPDITITNTTAATTTTTIAPSPTPTH